MADPKWMKFFGKKVYILTDNGREWLGILSGFESPEDSEDGNFWIDVDVIKPQNFGSLTVREDEIVKISLVK